jgi:hypothetical protein
MLTCDLALTVERTSSTAHFRQCNNDVLLMEAVEVDDVPALTTLLSTVADFLPDDVVMLLARLVEHLVGTLPVLARLASSHASVRHYRRRHPSR